MSSPRPSLDRLLAPLAAGGLALVLGLQLLIGSAAADLAEPSLNIAVLGFLAATLFLAACRAALAGETSLPEPRIWFAFVHLLAAAWVSLSVADDPYAALRRAATWTACLGVLGLAISLAASARGRAALLAAILATAAILAILATRERLLDSPQAREAFLRDPTIAAVPPELAADFRARLFTDQASGPFVIPNGLGAYFAATALAAAGVAAALLATSRRAGAAPAALAAALTAAIALAGQKGSWLGLAAGAVVAARRRWLLALGAAAALAIAIAVAVTPTERLERLPGGTSIAVRRDYARTALAMAFGHGRKVGVGAGNFGMHASVHKPPRGEESRYAHNDYLEALAEMGPLGLAGLLILWPILLTARREPSPPEPAPGAEDGRPPPRLELALGAGGALAFALLPIVGLRYREPVTALAAGAAYSVIYAWLLPRIRTALEARPDLVAAGAAGGAGAFAAQSAIDFLHPEAGLLFAALALAAVAAGPGLRVHVRLPVPIRGALPVVAFAVFAFVASFALPRAIDADLARDRLLSHPVDGRPDAKNFMKMARAIPFDVHARVLVADLVAAEDRAAAIPLYREAIGGRAGLADVKRRLGDLLPAGSREAADAYEAAVAAYPTHPRYRFLAGRALAAIDPARAAGHLEEALALDPVVRHERNRLSREERREAGALLDTLRAPAYNGR